MMQCTYYTMLAIMGCSYMYMLVPCHSVSLQLASLYLIYILHIYIYMQVYISTRVVVVLLHMKYSASPMLHG